MNGEFVKLLVDKGADLNAGDKDGMTALMHVAKKRDLNILKFLIIKGADVNVKDKNGRTALSHALSYASNVEIIRYLKAHGAK